MSRTRIGLSLFLAVASANAAVLHVPKDFPKIQDAVDASASGDTILISSGSYTEDVVVDAHPGLELRAQGKVTLVPQLATVALTLADSSDVTVQGLRFKGHAGAITANACDGLVLRACRAEDTTQNAFTVTGSADVLLDHCTVSGAG